MQYDNDDIRNIIYKNIDDNFAYGKLGDFEVILMRSNGYCNASKLCALINKLNKNKGNDLPIKKYKNWKLNKSSVELISVLKKELEESFMLPNFGVTISIKEGYLKKYAGTYVHPDLINDIARWCSPEYGLRMGRIFNAYHSQKSLDDKRILKKKLKNKDIMLKKKDDKLDKMLIKVDKISHDNDILLNFGTVQIDKINKMNREIKKLQITNDELLETANEISNTNNDTNDKINRIVNDRVVPTGNKNDEPVLVIIRNNIDINDYEDDEPIYNYHVLRIMKRSMNSSIERHRIIYPDMDIIKIIFYNPSSVNLWIRIKNFLVPKKIELVGSRFNIIAKNYSCDDLIKDIMKIHNSRLIHDDA